ncbi:hypothetical protein N7508_007504, partial [Penicillium antarcticum]|uniref:uncharacterized protein n=1 Tax=Penicillium antarcticum TaxID=416450 RepID=UPI0023872F48
HTPISVAASHGRVNTVACLLDMWGVEINGRGLIDPPISRAVAHGHLDVARLLVQQGARLNINESTIASHDTALCIAARGGDLQMAQALLHHDQTDANLRNKWFENPLILAVKGGLISIKEILAKNDYIKTASRSRMEDDSIPQILLRRSPRTRFGGL